MIERVERFGKILGIVTALIGIWTFVAKTIYEVKQNEVAAARTEAQAELVREADSREILKSIIYRVMGDQRQVPLADLFDQVREEATSIETVSRSELSDQNFWRILMEMEADGLVLRAANATLSVNRSTDAVDAQTAQAEVLQRMQDQTKIDGAIQDLIKFKPGKYTDEEVSAMVSTSTAYPIDLVREVVSQQIQTGFLIRDARGGIAPMSWTLDLDIVIRQILMSGSNSVEKGRLISVAARRSGFEEQLVSSYIEANIRDGLLTTDASGNVVDPMFVFPPLPRIVDETSTATDN